MSLGPAVKKLIEPLRPARVEAPPSRPTQPEDAQGYRPDPSKGTVRMTLDAPKQGQWTLRDPDGGAVCTLPCTTRMGRETPYYIESENHRRVDLHPFNHFRSGESLTATWREGRGSTTGAAVVLGLGIPAVILGALLFDFEGKQWCNPDGSACSTSQDPGKVQASTAPGAAAIALGSAVVIGGVILAFYSQYEGYRYKLADRVALSLDPRALALHF